MTYKIDFDLRDSSVRYGKFIIDAFSDGGDDPLVNVFIDIIAPDGSMLNTKNFSVPDMAVVTHVLQTWDIPTDSNGDWMRGTYEVRLYIEQTTTTPGTYDEDRIATYYYRAYDNAAALRWDEICVPGVVGVLTLVDGGNYDAFDVVSRELKVQFPPQEALADMTSAGTSLTFSPNWTGVDYIGSVTGEYLAETADGTIDWREYYSFSQQVTKTFSCSSCEITECVSEFAAKVAAKPSLSPADRDRISLLGLYESAYRGERQCGNLAGAALWASKISDVLGCDCGCGDTDGPQPFETPYFDALLADADADSDPTNELLVSAVLNGTDLELTDAGGTTTVDLSSLVGAGSPGSWTLIDSADTFGAAWDTVTNANPQLQWRTVGDSHVELMGTIGKAGLTPGTASTFLFGFFEGLGIDLKAFYGHPITMVENNAAVSMEYGGALTVQYSGTSDNFAIHVDPNVTIVGTARYFIHTLIPIVP